MLEKIIGRYLPGMEELIVQPIGSGLIHRTWKVGAPEGGAYILQEMNTAVFTDPDAIAHNMELVGRPLMKTVDGEVYCRENAVVFRMFPFVAGSRTYDVVSRPEQAFEAARQFGLFTRNLGGLEVGKLKVTLPGFHDLPLRYEQFERAVAEGDAMRVRESGALIGFLESQRELVDRYLGLKRDPGFALRVTHHDTKISNVLFDASGRGLCVIDLDTVMPGYFISDVGDMIRTYVSPASEEEVHLSAIGVRREFYRAIYDGYMGVMGDGLSAVEREHFGYSGLFLTYMQALRFLTDHLNRDIYYGARYDGHNYNRAANQAELLRRLLEFQVSPIS